MHTREFLALLTIGIGVSGLGCGLEEIEGGDGGEQIPAAVQAAFDESCATSSACHSSGSTVVILSAPESAAILTSSSASGGGPLVSFGDVEGSYLAQKILGGSSIIGGQMPPSPQSPDDDVNTAIIVGWIAGVPLEGEGGDGDGDGDTLCYIAAPLPAVPSFETDIWPILESRCATMGCHANASVPLMPDAMAAYDNIVGAPALAAMANYVEPDAPDASYLWHKLAGTFMSIEGGSGATMPSGGELCPTEFQAIYAWILTGAAP